MLGLLSKEKDSFILRDLLMDIYAKFDCITQGHQYTLDVIQHITEVNRLLICTKHELETRRCSVYRT